MITFNQWKIIKETQEYSSYFPDPRDFAYVWQSEDDFREQLLAKVQKAVERFWRLPTDEQKKVVDFIKKTWNVVTRDMFLELINSPGDLNYHNLPPIKSYSPLKKQ